MNPDFLTVDDVLIIHEDQINEFGGSFGLRDRALLESAIAQPQISFDGIFVHIDLFQMAASYLYHLTSNHPFVDGNKRIGLAAALVFLEINGIEILKGTDELFELTMRVAFGAVNKQEIAIALRSLSEL
jgi:death on curing protein